MTVSLLAWQWKPAILFSRYPHLSHLLCSYTALVLFKLFLIGLNQCPSVCSQIKSWPKFWYMYIFTPPPPPQSLPQSLRSLWPAVGKLWFRFWLCACARDCGNLEPRVHLVGQRYGCTGDPTADQPLTDRGAGRHSGLEIEIVVKRILVPRARVPPAGPGGRGLWEREWVKRTSFQHEKIWKIRYQDSL